MNVRYGKLFAFAVIITMLFGMPLSNSNYQFQVTPTNEVPLGPVDFTSPSADSYQYIDATQAETHGIVTTDPPLGMGVDDTTYSTLTEGSFSETSYDVLQYATFSGIPASWAFSNFVVSGGVGTSSATSSTRSITTIGYDLSSGYTGARIVYKHRAYDFISYLYEVGDYEIEYYDGSWHDLADVSSADSSGAWKTGDHSIASTYAAFKFRMISDTATTTEQIQTDDWYIYGIVSTTYYRFEAVFRFDSTQLGLASYALYVDFYSALSGSDDLDFYIGTTANPTTSIANDKQNDFSVVVTNHITASTMYLKIVDDYRSGDSVQTSMYIQRCYLYSPEEEVGWYDNDWLYRKQIPIIEQAGSGTNYQIPIMGYYNDSSKDVAGSVDFEALCQADFDDVRFTASNGTTLLDYWIDPDFYASGTSAKFWVEVTADISDTAYDVKIFVYFGNPSVSEISSPDDTFILFEDFENNNYDRWDETDNVAIKTDRVHGGIYSSSWSASAGSNLIILDVGMVSGAILITFWNNIENTLRGGQCSAYTTVDKSEYIGYVKTSYETSTSELWYYSAGFLPYPGSDDDLNDDEWDKIAVGYDITNLKWRTWQNDVYNSEIDLVEADGTAPETSEIAGVSLAIQSGYQVWFDDIIIRKYNFDTEPTFAAPAVLEYQDLYAPEIHTTSYSPINPTTTTGLTVFAIVTDADVVEMHSVIFTALAYPAGYNTSTTLTASEVGANTWAYTFDAADLPTGVYCFVVSAEDTIHNDVASYDQYITVYVTQAKEDQITCYIVVFDTLGNFIPFETFEVYRNNERQYNYQFACYDYEPQNITVVDRWGETLNSTEFDAGTIELVVVVDVYSLKIMSWYEDFAYFNITHGGLTYTEVITPLEVVHFRLYTGLYTVGFNYRNGSGWFSTNVNLINSTALILTGSTIADVAGLSTNILAMTTEINVTVVSTNNQVLTISIDLDNVNATINNQLIQVLLNITNSNTTIYQQTVDLLAAIQNSNVTLYSQIASFIIGVYANQSTIYSQTISILNELSFISSNITADYISLSSTLSLIDSSIASNFTAVVAELTSISSDITTNYLSLAATLNAIDSSLLTNFTMISATLSLLDSNLLSNFTSVISELSAIGSNVTTNYLSLAATLNSIDSNLLSNFTSVSAELLLIDSNLFSNFTSITSSLTSIGSNITTNYLSLAATLSAIDSNLLSNFTSISASLLLIDSNLFSNFTVVASTLSAIGSNITSNYLSVATQLLSIDSNLFSNFTSISATLSLIDSNLYSNFTSIVSTLSSIGSNITTNYLSLLAQLLSVNSTINTQVLTVLAYAIETNSAVNLVLDPDTFYIMFADFSFSDSYTHFHGMSDYHNATITIYEDDVAVTTPISELNVPIIYPLSTTPGTHNLSAKFVSGANVAWYNTSYTVSAVYGEATINAFYSSGIGITDIEDKFMIYVDGVRSKNTFYGNTSETYEICVKDYFGNEIYNASHAWSEFIDISFDFYTLKIYSQVQNDPIYFILTRGNATISEYIGIGEILYYYLASGTYTYIFLQGGMAYTGPIVLTDDYYYTVEDLDLWDIMNKPDNAGGDDDTVELRILSVLTYGIIGIFGVIFVLQIPAVQDKLPGNKRRRQRPAPTPAPQGNKEWDGTRK